ncbi:prepilin-type N-terminal cleavage/methylation domain-containing protein [Neptunicella marina]|uniref:Prepilin-type N-terminal cleavage/methylation domain-containing protein n=1 Tax=Neptunicella marina TaxID=2125989 RepID=A0A8J6ISK1_9ALTE|nr:prepilin-type N-terminal cleavage/methylation domain-containing protein [Neptunicella marina]
MLNYISRGFSLLEAMVALVILSLIYTAVWGWYGAAVTSTNSIENNLALPQIFEQFKNRLMLEDLSKDNSGQYVIDTYTINWTSSIIKRSDTNSFRRQLAWIVALVGVHAVIQKNDSVIKVFDVQLTTQWRDPTYVEPPTP